MLFGQIPKKTWPIQFTKKYKTKSQFSVVNDLIRCHCCNQYLFKCNSSSNVFIMENRDNENYDTFPYSNKNQKSFCTSLAHPSRMLLFLTPNHICIALKHENEPFKWIKSNVEKWGHQTDYIIVSH